MSSGCAERVCYLFLEKWNDYTKYPMLDVEEWSTGYWNSPEASEGAERNLKTGADQNRDNLPEPVDDDDDWDFDCTICAESAHFVGVKRRLQDLQDVFRTNKQNIPTNVAEEVEYSRELRRSLSWLVCHRQKFWVPREEILLSRPLSWRILRGVLRS